MTENDDFRAHSERMDDDREKLEIAALEATQAFVGGRAVVEGYVAEQRRPIWQQLWDMLLQEPPKPDEGVNDDR